MEILEYNDVDPLQVMYITQLALDFPLTPEAAAHIRNTDPRPFPFLAIYGMENGVVLGQVGIFRLPMISIEGREDVGGIWAVATHPHFAGRGVASHLLEDAHRRMREAGLRFSTLITNRCCSAYQLYIDHGYVETNILATALARWETAHQPTRLSAQPVGLLGYDLIEHVFQDVAKDFLGFAWRQTPFTRLRRVELKDIWLLKENQHIVGYVLTRTKQSLLSITDLVLQPGIDAAEGVSAVTSKVRSAFVQVQVSRPGETTSLQRAGFHVANPTWGGFMIKPLRSDASVDESRRLFGIGTDRFLISWLDVT